MTRNAGLMLLSRAGLFFAGLGLMLAGVGTASADNLIGAPGIAGASAWTVYAFGNAQAVADAFRALANFTASSTFQSIVGFIAVMGILSVGVSSGFSSMVAKRFIGYAISVFLITYIFFGVGSGGPLVVQVEITDTVDGTWVAPVTVPAVVGIPASVISTAGQEITKQIEASFPLPDALKMSKGAPFNLAASLINDAGQARISDPYLASSMAYYIQDCFTIEAARGTLPTSTLTASTNFIADIESKSNAIMVSTLMAHDAYPAGTNSVVTCATAWSLINTAVNSSGTGASAWLKSASAWAKTPLLSVVDSAADGVAQWATNSGITDGGSMVKQAAVLAAFKGGFSQAAAATGSSEFLTAFNMAQAQQTQVSGWVMGAEVFNRSMGYVYAVIQVFVYAVLPLILAAALVPGLGFALIKNFGQILLWLAIWQPMLSIVNFIVLSMQQADLGGALSNGAGAYGFTLANMGVISEKTANMRAAALFIGAMVPTLAWSLVKGSVDFSRFIGEAAGEKFAHSAANSMVTGNYSINQGAMDSFTANKHSMGQTHDYGEGYTSSNAGVVERALNQGGGVAIKNKGQNVAVANSDTLGASDGGQQQHMTAETRNAAISAVAAAIASFAQTGGRHNSGSKAETAHLQRALDAAFGGNLAPRGPGSGGGGGDGTGGPASKAQQAAMEADILRHVPADKRGLVQKLLSAMTLTLRGSASRDTAYNHQEAAQLGTQGSVTLNGTTSKTGGTGLTDANSAATNTGFQHTRQRAITGLSAAEDQMELLDSMKRRSPAEGNLYYKEGTPGSTISSAVRELSKSGAVDKAVAEQKEGILKQQDDHSKKLTDIDSQANEGVKAARDKAEAERKAAQKDESNYKGEATKPLMTKVGEVLSNLAHDAGDSLNKLLDDMGGTPSANPAAVSTTPPMLLAAQIANEKQSIAHSSDPDDKRMHQAELARLVAGSDPGNQPANDQANEQLVQANRIRNAKALSSTIQDPAARAALDAHTQKLLTDYNDRYGPTGDQAKQPAAADRRKDGKDGHPREGKPAAVEKREQPAPAQQPAKVGDQAKQLGQDNRIRTIQAPAEDPAARAK